MDCVTFWCTRTKGFYSLEFYMNELYHAPIHIIHCWSWATLGTSARIFHDRNHSISSSCAFLSTFQKHPPSLSTGPSAGLFNKTRKQYQCFIKMLKFWKTFFFFDLMHTYQVSSNVTELLMHEKQSGQCSQVYDMKYYLPWKMCIDPGHSYHRLNKNGLN